ncbi:hypothetical protein B0H63DRAFT_392697 [Podospora didyma]|uniref:Uncharacterized protein n=1 Tax=Podospora didyma TaxID=330526 RepID=A0AAE0U1Q4_9PEZI|nr:hypothetical protein B0H63DRAFT_392697 [Podospora didyma]
MESISYSIATADRLKHFIHAEVKATGNKVSSDKEARASKAAKAKAKTQAIAALQTTLSLVDSTLASLRSVDKPKPSKITNGTIAAASAQAQEARGAVAATAAAAAVASDASPTLPDSAKSLLTSMSADSKSGLGSQTQSLQDMAKAIQPIITSFNDVLTKPYLDKYSATLNTVPVIGLKNNQIMYLATVSSVTSPTGTKEEWTYFSALPDGITADPSTAAVHFFPYKGDFCLSVGTAVWRKRHRTGDDPTLQQAVGNWPKMYVDEWQKISDTAFPAADLRDVVPFAVLSADRTQIDFHLAILAQDSTISVLANDDIYPANQWTPLTYQQQNGDPATLPVWNRLAYWNNSIVALDDHNNTWTLQPSFQTNTYTIGDQATIQPTTEFTATDIGPVAAHADGFLYKRIVSDPPSDGSDPQLEWTKWVAQDGVTNLGVAAPGVLLDLQTLTRTLKARYIDAQTAVYPVVNRINAFAVTHNTYLDQLLAAAADYNSNPGDPAKQAAAIQAGKGFVTHAKLWAKVLNTSVNNTYSTVTIMTQQLHDVKNQLEVQLQLLRDKLVGLQSTLASQEETMSKLKAAFWGAVAAMFLGMALGVIALGSGVGTWALVGAGALFLAGFAAMIALGVKMGDLAAEISDTNSKIQVTETAITQLSSVVQNFTDLDSLYGTLNMFWGRMGSDTASLQTMDDVTAELLAIDLFDDTSSIVAAQSNTNELGQAALLYLDTLHKQGIMLPTAALNGDIAETLSFDSHVANAQAALSNGDVSQYEGHMDKAFSASLATVTTSAEGNMYMGLWYDIPRISSAAALIQPQPTTSVLLSTDPSTLTGQAAIGNRVNVATPVVVAMLKSTSAMSATVQDLCSQYSALTAKGDSDAVAKLKDTLLQKAMDDCTSAQKFAAQANNAFVDVNHACQEYTNGLEAQANGLAADGRAAEASADEQKNDISIPWYVYMGGAVAVIAYTETKKKEINDDLHNKLDQINGAIAQLKDQEKSGATLNGHSLTWTDMVTAVSGCLGGVFSILTAVSGQVLENPAMYETLLDVEWAAIQKNTTEVLNILASRGVNVSSPVQPVQSLVVVNGAISDTNTTEKIVNALSAPVTLASNISAQAKQAQDFLAQTQALLDQPHLGSIVSYWDDANRTTKTSLLDVVTGLRREYVDAMAAQFPVIDALHAASVLQESRAGSVANGKLSLDGLVRSSLRSSTATALSATDAAGKFSRAVAGYDSALAQITAHLEDVKQKLSDAQYGKEVEGGIADLVAQTSASSQWLLTSQGVSAPIVTALKTAQTVGLNAHATAAAVGLAIDPTAGDKLLGALQSVKRFLETANDALVNTVQPLLKDLADLAGAVETAVREIVAALAAIKGGVRDANFSDEDVKQIGGSWVAVADASLEWMGVVNAQGIAPSL